MLIELQLQINMEEGFCCDILDNYRKLVPLMTDLKIGEITDVEGTTSL